MGVLLYVSILSIVRAKSPRKVELKPGISVLQILKTTISINTVNDYYLLISLRKGCAD